MLIPKKHYPDSAGGGTQDVKTLSLTLDFMAQHALGKGRKVGQGEARGQRRREELSSEKRRDPL